MQPSAYGPHTLLSPDCQNGAWGAILTLPSMPLTVLDFPVDALMHGLCIFYFILFYSILLILFYFSFLFEYICHIMLH